MRGNTNTIITGRRILITEDHMARLDVVTMHSTVRLRDLESGTTAVSGPIGEKVLFQPEAAAA